MFGSFEKGWRFGAIEYSSLEQRKDLFLAGLAFVVDYAVKHGASDCFQTCHPGLLVLHKVKHCLVNLFDRFILDALFEYTFVLQLFNAEARLAFFPPMWTLFGHYEESLIRMPMRVLASLFG